VLGVPLLYATDANNRTLHTVNTATGAATLVGSFGAPGYMAGLAYDPAKDVLYGTTTGDDRLYSINRSTGAATLIGGLGVKLMHGLAFDASRQILYGAFGGQGNDGLYRIDTTTGVATLIGHTGFFHPDHLNSVHGLAVHPVTGVLYGMVSGPTFNWDALIRINKDTGQGTLIGTNTQHVSGLACDPVTGTLYGTDNWTGRLYTIDTSTANVTLVGSTGLANPLGLEFTPEPATLMLLAFGGLVITRRRM